MERAKRHGPNRLQSYLDIHTTVMAQMLYAGQVEEDGLELPNGASGALVFDGELLLRDRRLKVTVTKVLEVLDDTDPSNPLVQTSMYSYNVSLVGYGNVFRYCSPHEDGSGIPHHEHHHRHQYDPFGAEPDSYEVSFGGDDWPTLQEVISEADEWYLSNQDRVLALNVMGS